MTNFPKSKTSTSNELREIKRNAEQGIVKKQMFSSSVKMDAKMQHEEYSKLQKFPEWKSISKYITRLFRDPFSVVEEEMDLIDIHDNLLVLQRTEQGSKLINFFLEEIKRPMIAIREEVKDLSGLDLLKKLSSIWNLFYSSILPSLLAFYYPLEARFSLQKLIISLFSEIILLRVRFLSSLREVRQEIDESTRKESSLIPHAISHMLLIFQMESELKGELVEALTLAKGGGFKSVWIHLDASPKLSSSSVNSMFGVIEDQ